MAFQRLSALTRVLLFFLVLQVLLVLVGTPLQLAFGLPGHSAMEVLVFAGLAVAFAAWVEKKPVRPFLRFRMLSLKGVAKSVVLGLAGWFMALQLGVVAGLILEQLGGELVQPYDFLFEAPVWVALVSGSLVPAICEELSFRGYLLGASRPFSPKVAVLLSGLLFGMMHMSLIRLIPLALLGALWALAVQRSGSILPGIIGHLLNNGIALSLHAIFAQGETNPAEADVSLAILDSLPPTAVWIAIGVTTLVALGVGVVAYLVAVSFDAGDLARPEELHDDPAPAPDPDRPVFASPEDVPEEVRALEAELAGLQQRRRRILQAVAVISGLLSLLLFLLLGSAELYMAFR